MAKQTIKSGTIIWLQGKEIEVLCAHSQPKSLTRWENGFLILNDGIQQFCTTKTMKAVLAECDDIIEPKDSELSDDDLLAELAA